MLKNYYYLTKPGIVYGNTAAAAAGYILAAARGEGTLVQFPSSIIGIALIIASACVLNNYIDRDIDILMVRTKRRALVSGRIAPASALVFGSILLLAGAGLMAAGSNLLALAAALAGWVFYVVVYGYFKRHSVYGTEIGSLSGAIPPVAGYAALTGRLDLAAALLFIVMVLWQMPHFYAIALFRRDDYAAASVPVLPVKRGGRAARRSIIIYMILLCLVTPLLSVFHYTGWTFLIETALINLWWLTVAILTWRQNDEVWARQIFKLSLLVLLNFCLMWSVGGLLP
ncbi:MAG: heme o synthase [Candidatus Saccharimonadales bacterium]